MADLRLPAADALMRRATRYLARHAASRARVREVLARAVRRQAGEADAGDAQAAAALIDQVIERLQRAGLLDDAAFARGRIARLAGKGRPAAAIAADLRHRHGLAVEDGEIGETLAALDPLAQAARWTARRRLGPFRTRDRAAKRDRDIASLVRAGFSVAVATAAIDASPDADAVAD